MKTTRKYMSSSQARSNKRPMKKQKIRPHEYHNQNKEENKSIFTLSIYRTVLGHICVMCTESIVHTRCSALKETYSTIFLQSKQKIS